VEAVEHAEISMKEALNISKDEALEILRESNHLDNINVLNSGFYQFLEGISSETKIDLEDIVIALNDGIYFAIGVNHFRDKALEELGFLRGGCTVAGYNNGILGQNNDNPIKYSGKTILVKSVDDKIMLLTMGSPLVMIMGMSQNLAIVVNTIDAFFAGHSIRKGGLPDAVIIMNALMRFTNVTSVIDNYKDAKMNVALAVTIADKEGGLATIEFNAKQFIGNIIFEPNEGEHFIAHANHPKHSDEYLIKTWFDGDEAKANQMLAKSFWRQEFAERFLATSTEKKAQELQQLFKTYPVIFYGSDDGDFRTTTSVIWDIRNQRAYISPDRPDITDYEIIEW
jgi:hypothetical protein